MKDLILHIGLTKTASTFLQLKVFGGKMYTLDRSRGEIIESDEEKKFHNFFRSYPPSVWRTKHAKEYLDFHSEENNILISNESLYEGTLSVFPNNVKGERSIAEPYLIADRLREISNSCWDKGDVKVFFFFRRQAEWISSFYSHICYRINNPSQGDFENRVYRILNNPYETGASALCYDILIEELQKALGESNVLALPYEALSADQTWVAIRNFTGFESLGKNVDFTNRHVNVKRLSEGGKWRAADRAQASTSSYLAEKAKKYLGDNYKRMKVLRKLSNLLKNVEKKLTKNIQIQMTSDLKRNIMYIFEESNKRTSSRVGVDLEQYGYY